MRQSDWADAGQGWQGKETTLRLHGWGRQRSIKLKNQWGWGGFTTQDLTRCRLLAGTVALVYNWSSVGPSHSD